MPEFPALCQHKLRGEKTFRERPGRKFGAGPMKGWWLLATFPVDTRDHIREVDVGGQERVRGRPGVRAGAERSTLCVWAFNRRYSKRQPRKG